MMLDLISRRDVLNFMRWRDGIAADDSRLAQFLLATFTVTNALRRPELVSTAERIHELNDVAARRASGVVRVLEIGHRIVGTYALMRPASKECLAWVDGAGYLRAVAIDPEFQGIRLTDSLMQDAHETAREWGAARVCLHLVRGSDGLARFYQKHGYEPDSRGDQFGKGFDLEGYQVRLGPRLVTA